MKHIELNLQGEAVKQFFLTLPPDADGSVVELDGQAVDHVFLTAANGKAGKQHAGPWTESKNRRWCELIECRGPARRLAAAVAGYFFAGALSLSMR
jgi:hypothetical protein